VAQRLEVRGNLPGLFYSYLGLAMAHASGRKDDGLQLCRYALKVQPKEPENYLNLANIYLMMGRRAAAVRALQDGLARAPRHTALQEFERRVGKRRAPVFSRLPRAHAINVLAGRVRHWFETKKEERLERQAEERELAAGESESSPVGPVGPPPVLPTS
jgi:tetratricopeptide (TPR) repeat protein